MKNKNAITKIKLILSIVIAITLWQVLAMVIDQNIILASPLDVGRRLLKLVVEKDFFERILFSLGRIAVGFICGFALGTIFAILSGKWENAEIFLKPYIVAAKSIPVASFVVLSLIYFSSENLSVFISFLMVFPIVYTNVLQGIKSIDPKMLQMAKVFEMSFGRRIKYLWLPSVKPFLISGSTVASGLAWKAGIAAEIIGIPNGSMGESLQESKIYLDTESLLAWTVVIVALSICTEKLFSLSLKGFFALCEVCIAPSGEEKVCTLNPSKVTVSDVCKSYGGEMVLNCFSAEFTPGVSILLGKSGSGKTTLLNIILKAESPDSGKVSETDGKMSAVFQEDRLCEDFTPLGNVVAVTGKNVSASKIASILEEMGLTEKDIYKKKTHMLSGGMKRRVAICRAICACSDIIVMDEPFKGLDPKTKASVIETVKKHIVGKTVILVTHDEEEALAVGGCQVIRL